MNITILLAVIQPAGVFALRFFATVAALTFAAIGVAIYRRRHHLFDRDPEVISDTPAARHVRVEAVAIVWTGVMLALLGVLLEVWRA
jgi:amino acid transporter